MKRIVFVLTACISVSLIACGGKASSGSGTSSSDSKSVAITIEVFDRGTDGGKSDPSNNEWTKWIKEKVKKDENIDVTFVRVPRWEEVTSLNNMMAAGNPPDVCLSYSSELVAQYRDLGGLTDIAPYIDTHLPDLKKFLGEDKALPGREFIRRNQDPETGAVYAIPARRINVAMRNLFIRKDWVEKVGLSLPNTTEEFYTVLKAFKEQDPGGVGKQNVIPFSMGNDVFWGLHYIMYAFIDPALSAKDRWINTVIERHTLLPGYKEGVRFANKLYNEGLIDRNFPLYKSTEEQTNIIKAGYVGSFSDVWDMIYRESNAILTDLQKNVPGSDLCAVDTITSSDGIRHKNSYDAAGVNFFIPKTCKNPAAALRYINWLSRYENYHFIQVGPEGVVHDIVDGAPKIKTASGLWIQNSPQNIDYTIHINGLELGDPELNIRSLANGYPWPPDRIEEAYTISLDNAVPDPVIPVSLSAAGAVMQTLIDKNTVLLTNAVTCSPGDFDRVWEEGVKDWLDSGAQSVVDERRNKYYEPK
jgi:putative aldouronate transport system substrate-binding protein